MSDDTYVDAFTAGYQQALAELQTPTQGEAPYVPTQEWEGQQQQTVNIGGVDYSADAALQAAAQMQVVTRLDAQAARETEQQAKTDAAEALAALEEKWGAAFKRDQKQLGEFLTANPGFLPDDADAQKLAEQLDVAYELMKTREAKQARLAKQIDDQAFAESLVASHRSGYESLMADRGA